MAWFHAKAAAPDVVGEACVIGGCQGGRLSIAFCGTWRFFVQDQFEEAILEHLAIMERERVSNDVVRICFLAAHKCVVFSVVFPLLVERLFWSMLVLLLRASSRC